MSDKLVFPVEAPTSHRSAVLADDQVAHWRDGGYLLIDGIFPPELIATLQDTGADHFPLAGSPQAESINDFGSAVNFPSRLAGFNDITLHPRLLAAVSQLLGCAPIGIRLTQSDLWPKYGRSTRTGQYDNQDQRIHFDYPNHTLAHPSPWDRPEAVEAILYLSDHDDCGGSTAVVPREGVNDSAYQWPLVNSPGIGDLPYINDRASAEEDFVAKRPELAQWRRQLYERERWTHFRPGTVLFYRHDVWHRGTPLTQGALRLAQNITYRRAECEWISTLHSGWAWAMYRDDKFMEKIVATSSLDQRAVLGFPQPGNSYWCDATIAAVEARYAMFDMDMTPYRDALTA